MMTGASSVDAASMIASACSILLMLKAGTPYSCSAAWSSNWRNVIRAMKSVLRAGADWPYLLSFLQNLDAGQRFSFHPFQEGAACGRHIAEIRGDARLIERRHRIATARDRNQPFRLGPLRRVARGNHGAAIERRHLESAQRAVPHQRRRIV